MDDNNTQPPHSAACVPMLVALDAQTYMLLEVLGASPTIRRRGEGAVLEVVTALARRAAEGIRWTGSERSWVIAAFGDDWLKVVRSSRWATFAGTIGGEGGVTLLVELDVQTYELLDVLGTSSRVGNRGRVSDVVRVLIAHAAAGVRWPSSWERDWVTQAFGHEWLTEVERVPPSPLRLQDRPREPLRLVRALPPVVRRCTRCNRPMRAVNLSEAAASLRELHNQIGPRVPIHGESESARRSAEADHDRTRALHAWQVTALLAAECEGVCSDCSASTEMKRTWNNED